LTKFLSKFPDYTKVDHNFFMFQNLHSLGLLSSDQDYNLNLDYNQRDEHKDTNDDEGNGPRRHGGAGTAGKCSSFFSSGVVSLSSYS